MLAGAIGLVACGVDTDVVTLEATRTPPPDTVAEPADDTTVPAPTIPPTDPSTEPTIEPTAPPATTPVPTAPRVVEPELPTVLQPQPTAPASEHLVHLGAQHQRGGP